MPIRLRTRLARVARLALPIGVLAITSCGDATGDNTTDDNAAVSLRALNAAYDRALLDADSVSLDSIYHPDFTYLGPDGVMRSRREQIATLMSGDVDVIEGKSDSVDVRLYGSTAILLGQFIGRAQVGPEQFAFRERYSTVWLRESGQWRLLVEHGTVLRAPLSAQRP